MRELIKVVLLPAVLGILGLYFTHTYNQARMKSDYAKTIHEYLSEIQSDDPVEAQIALEMLRPILTAEQEEVIGKVIEARQKIVVDQAVAEKNESILDRVREISKINSHRGDELTRYAQAAMFQKEAYELVASGEYEEAAEKFRQSVRKHSDFEKANNVAKLIEDKLVSQPIIDANEIEVLDSIGVQAHQIPIAERKKILERSKRLRLSKKPLTSKHRR